MDLSTLEGEIERLVLTHVICSRTGNVYLELEIFFVGGTSLKETKPLSRRPLVISLSSKAA